MDPRSPQLRPTITLQLGSGEYTPPAGSVARDAVPALESIHPLTNRYNVHLTVFISADPSSQFPFDMNPSLGYACVSRNEGDQCDWTGASPQFIQSKGQVNRDSLLIRQENTARLSIKHDFQNLHNQVESLISILKQNFPSSSSTVVKPEIVPVTNYHIEDVATQLSRFTLNQAIRQHPETPLHSNPNSQISVREIEEYVENEEKKALPNFTFNIGSGGFMNTFSSSSTAGIPSSATSPLMDGLLGIGKGPTSFEAILEELPKHIQIKACLDQFEYHRAWMHRILHRPTFWKQVSTQIEYNFAYTDQQAQAHWLAILFSVCGLGLFNNTIRSESTLKSYELPNSVRDQRALALRWCRAAASCLELGAYDVAPSMDSISAMAILTQLPLYTSNGETLGLALEFIGKAIDLAMQLDLHIDPDAHPVYRNATALVKQNRRRLMIALLCQHYKMGGLLCQDHQLRPLEQFSGLQLPLDQFDEDFSEDGNLAVPRTPGATHTIMTGVRCRFEVSRIWQEIGIMFSKPFEPPTHETVLEINTKLEQLQSKWPMTIWTHFNPTTCTFIPPLTLLPNSSTGLQVLLIDRLGCFAVFAAAMVRLHRGFLIEIDGVPVEDIKMHREQVYHYGRAMLAIHRTKVFPLDNVPLQFFVLSSTISLAVYCLTQTSSEEENKCEIVVKELEQIKNVLKSCTGLSSILRRTYAVLDFALNKWAIIKRRADPDTSRSHKRLKVDADNNSQQASNNVDVTRTQVAKVSEVQVSSELDINLGRLEPQEDSRYDPRAMENLFMMLTQARQWPDNLNLSHDKQQKRTPQQKQGQPSGFSQLPNNTDWTHGFQFDFSQPMTGNASAAVNTNAVGNVNNVVTSSTVSNSNIVGDANIAGNTNTTLQSGGSSMPYLSRSSSSSSNLLRQSVFNEQELNASPISLNYPSTIPFGSNFNEKQDYVPQHQFGNSAYPVLPNHAAINASYMNSNTIPTKNCTDEPFENDDWSANNKLFSGGSNLLNSKSI